MWNIHEVLILGIGNDLNKSIVENPCFRFIIFLGWNLCCWWAFTGEAGSTSIPISGGVRGDRDDSESDESESESGELERSGGEEDEVRDDDEEGATATAAATAAAVATGEGRRRRLWRRSAVYCCWCC